MTWPNRVQLDTLVCTLVSDTAAPAQVTTLQLDQIKPNPKNVREDMNLTDWFVDSIRENGVVVPVVVLPPLRADGPYELVMPPPLPRVARSGPGHHQRLRPGPLHPRSRTGLHRPADRERRGGTRGPDGTGSGRRPVRSHPGRHVPPPRSPSAPAARRPPSSRPPPPRRPWAQPPGPPWPRPTATSGPPTFSPSWASSTTTPPPSSGSSPRARPGTSPTRSPGSATTAPRPRPATRGGRNLPPQE